MLGDLYESADRAPVTELPVHHADAPPDLESELAETGFAESEFAEAGFAEAEFAAPVVDERAAALEAARLRAEEAALPAPAPEPEATIPAKAVPVLVHDPSHDDLLPRRASAAGRLSRLRK